MTNFRLKDRQNIAIFDQQQYKLSVNFEQVKNKPKF